MDIDEKVERRLDHIYEVAEAKWTENLERLKGHPIHYLLVGEAAPWTPTDPIRYFYNTFDSQVHKAIWSTLFPEVPRPDLIEKGLQRVAERGFLPVDSLPFAMGYSEPSSIRNKKLYIALVKACSAFLADRIAAPGIEWAEDLKVAFYLPRNARAIAAAFPTVLTVFVKRQILVEDRLAVANSFGGISVGRLKNVYRL